MATWLILVVAALVLAVIGATTAATWLLVIGILTLVVGLFWAATERTARRREVVRARDRASGAGGL